MDTNLHRLLNEIKSGHIVDALTTIRSILEGALEDRKRMKSDIEDLKRRVRQIESEKARC